MTSFTGLKQTAQGITSFVADKAISTGIAVIAVLLALSLSFNYLSSHFWAPKTTIDVRNIIISGVKNVHELTTATMDIKESVVMDKEAQFFGIPVGNTHLVYEGVGRVQAGLNLDKLQVIGEVSDKSNKNQKPIQLLLPAPAITAVDLDVNHSSTLANYSEWFGEKAGVDLYAKAQQKAIDLIRAEACANQILDAANNNAAIIIQDILTKVGVENFEIKTQTSAANSCPIQ